MVRMSHLLPSVVVISSVVVSGKGVMVVVEVVVVVEAATRVKYLDTRLAKSKSYPFHNP